MANITVTKNVESLRKLFNKMDEAYYYTTPNIVPASTGDFLTADFEWPVLEDGGVTFNTGDLDVTKVKLTTGATWTSYSEVQDSDISFQVATLDDSIVSLFFEKKNSTGIEVNSKNYSANGYGIEPKKCTGGLLLMSEDKQSMIFLPNIEAYGSMTYDDGKPIYINVTVTPLGDTNNGVAFYVLTPSE